jgi:hypothetical protein
MSQLGTPFSPPPPYAPPPVPPPSRPTSADIPGWMVLLAAFLAFGLAGLLAFVVVHGRDDGTAAPAPRHVIHHYPEHWNHRIAPLARIAAKDRGLAFEHPVGVRFLKPAAFRKTLTKSDGKTTPRDRRQIERAEGELRALGLLSGHVDLLQATKSANGAEVLAYYSFRTKSITVRGRTLTPSIKATLVHELTHVLQDQNFRIGHRLKELQKAKGPDTGTYDVLDAIVEGDADRVEQQYRASLTPTQQHALDAAQRREQAGAQSGLTHVPHIVVALMSAPYELGLAMTQAVSAQGGNTAVNHLLRTPPTHDVTLLDPVRALTGATGAAHVAAPTLAGNEKKLESGEFGAVSLYLTLASRLPEQASLAAADGWGGDSYVAYHQGQTTCMRVHVTGRTSEDTSRIYSSLRAWSAAGPDSSSVAMVNGVVQLQSCDPGTKVRSGTESSTKAVTYAAVRNQYVVTLSRAHVPPAAAQCITTHLFDSYPFSELSDPTFGSHDPSVQAQVREFAIGCR